MWAPCLHPCMHARAPAMHVLLPPPLTRSRLKVSSMDMMFGISCALQRAKGGRGRSAAALAGWSQRGAQHQQHQQRQHQQQQRRRCLIPRAGTPHGKCVMLFACKSLRTHTHTRMCEQARRQPGKRIAHASARTNKQTHTHMQTRKHRHTQVRRPRGAHARRHARTYLSAPTSRSMTSASCAPVTGAPPISFGAAMRITSSLSPSRCLRPCHARVSHRRARVLGRRVQVQKVRTCMHACMHAVLDLGASPLRLQHAHSHADTRTDMHAAREHGTARITMQRVLNKGGPRERAQVSLTSQAAHFLPTCTQPTAPGRVSRYLSGAHQAHVAQPLSALCASRSWCAIQRSSQRFMLILLHLCCSLCLGGRCRAHAHAYTHASRCAWCALGTTTCLTYCGDSWLSGRSHSRVRSRWGCTRE